MAVVLAPYRQLAAVPDGGDPSRQPVVTGALHATGMALARPPAVGEDRVP